MDALHTIKDIFWHLKIARSLELLQVLHDNHQPALSFILNSLSHGVATYINWSSKFVANFSDVILSTILHARALCTNKGVGL